jgi:D-alanyl-lipoteichoic acid acyltransferase DltB (MBOAT superfamily)
MLFPTFTFAIFFIIVLAGAWALEHSNGQRKLFLILASFVFYGWWDWRLCGLLLASAVLNWAIGALIAPRRGTASAGLLMGLGVLVNLSILGFFKYYGFFIESAGVALAQFGLERDLLLLQVILPVGISFYTFQGISYIVDLKRGDLEEAASLPDTILYISFFPQLVAGPIVRAKHFLPQLSQTPRLSRNAAALGLLLIVWGLFKKTVIASELADGIVDPIFYDPASYGSIDLLFGVYAYAVQIYCDFSAYSDIAIGVAALLGYQFNRNFDQPYRASSFQDFWRRWHISLSTWLRDYLYIPLGGSKGGGFATSRNLFLTMLLGGLWHGAAWTFLVWGAFHGAALLIERAMGLARSGRGILGILITFHGVCAAWILFRSPDFATAMAYFAGFAQFNMPVFQLTPFLAVLTIAGLALHALPSRGIERAAIVLARMPSFAAAAILAILFVLVEALRQPGVAPFIYFQF